MDGAAFTPCAAPTGQSYTGLGTGVSGVSHTFSVRAANAVNTATDSYTWMIAPAAPTVTITTPVGNTVSTTPASFAWTVGGGGAATVACSIDSGAFVAPCTSPKAYAGLATTPSGAPHTFAVRATNANPTTPTVTASRTWTVLPPPPAVTNLVGPGNSTSTAAGFTWLIGGGGATTVQCSLDTGAFGACATTTSASLTVPAATTATGTPHTFRVRVTNANPTTPTVTTAPFAWTVLPPPPTISITSGPANPALDTAAHFVWDAGIVPANVTCDLDGTAVLACASPLDLTVSALAQHTFTVTATNANPASPAVASWTWTSGP
jgi:hypothetical protein